MKHRFVLAILLVFSQSAVYGAQSSKAEQEIRKLDDQRIAAILKQDVPWLDRLMADAQRGLRDFEAVVCWKFDRFARSTTHLLRALETFQSLNLAFISLTEAVDTSTPYGKLVFTILGAVAELERSLIAERIKNGMKKAGAKKPGPKIGTNGPSRTTRWRQRRQTKNDLT